MTMSDTEHMQAELNDFAARVREWKGEYGGPISLDFHPNAEPCLYVNCFPQGNQFMRAATWKRAIYDGNAYLSSIPSAEEMARQAWMAKLGALIDDGRALGIHADFVNPLVVAMQALSENALTYNPAPSAPLDMPF